LWRRGFSEGGLSRQLLHGVIHAEEGVVVRVDGHIHPVQVHARQPLAVPEAVLVPGIINEDAAHGCAR
jgi:hypothetical protein